MKYISTRGNFKKVDSAEAIRLGMVPAGGLFVPERIPRFTSEEILDMGNKSYQELAEEILKKYLTDFRKDKLTEMINTAYSEHNFPPQELTPLVSVGNNKYILELWHGPTAAFKDLALQFMPYLLREAVKMNRQDSKLVILVATSGDTGKAALEGFRDIPGIEIVVFFPDEGISMIQKRQMLSTGGNNTAVVAVRGNFDDCQNAVKDIFADQNFRELVRKNGYQFSSANSINWGRLVPQIVYYFAAYSNLVKRGDIKNGQKINITVPTGNFGNILAGFYAYKMGLPVHRFICASNENKVLTDFFHSGTYSLKREFKKTISPSMDILISSNLERFLFINTDYNSQLINKWYNDLKTKGEFTIDSSTRGKIDDIFRGEFADEQKTRAVIGEVYGETGYLIDPHTAVGVSACNTYREKEERDIPVIIASTASPYKFSKAVLEAVKGEKNASDEFAALQELKDYTGKDIHRALENIETSKIKHSRTCNKEEIRNEIKNILSIS